MPTISEMREEVKDILAKEGLNEPPNVKRVYTALNAAKDELVARLESLDEQRFTTRAEFDVAKDNESIELPSGFRRLLGLTEVTDSNGEYAIKVLDPRSEESKSCPAGFWMYREGNHLWFHDPDGAARAMTIRMRYVAKVDDLDGSAAGAEYTSIPADAARVIPLMAAADLLPSDVAGQIRWRARANEKLALILGQHNSEIATRPMRIRYVDDWDDD
jgi:hypothetical protein